MKFNSFIQAGLMMGLIGCAQTPKVQTQQAAHTVSPNLGLEYIKNVGSQSSRTSENSSSCPEQARAVKTVSWREQMKAANSCVLKNNWAMVEQLGQQMAQGEHLAPWGAYYLSLAAENRKEYPRSMWMIELALKKAPQSGLLQYQKGRVQWLTGDHSAAQKTWLQALDQDRRLVDAQVLLAQMALANNDNAQAGTRFQAALQVEPRLLPALLGAAEVAIRSKDIKEANDLLSQAVFHHPSSTRARVRQAEVIETIEKNFNEALSAYKRIKSLARERKLDVALDIDVEAKIKALEIAVKQQQAPSNQLSLREPAEGKKESK